MRVLAVCARSRTASVCGIDVKCSRTWCVQLPDGDTMQSYPLKFLTNKASVAAASSRHPLFPIGCPQQV